MAQESQDLPGYERSEPIRESGAAAVYRARRAADGADVVVKRSLGTSLSARQLIRYRNEHELLSTLTCSGVVKCLGLLRHEGQIALILEDLKGCSLRQWIEASPNARIEERLEIGVKLADILAGVHRADVIHKDVNSHNVVYDRASGVCTLIDFGIATRLRSEENRFQAAAALEGTLAYIAPEQTGRMNRGLDYRADLYSLGVTLYELFTGVLPHDSSDPLEMVHFHIAGKAVPPSERDTRVPGAVSDIVMKLMQKEPQARYQSAAGLAADLRNCLAQLQDNGHVKPFALGGRDAVDRFEPPQKLYGRAAETRTLLESFERVARGGVETILVSGEGGVGKTSLVQEIYQPITRRRGYFASGKFDQLQQNVPFSALVAALQELVSQLLTESEESIAHWREAIRAAVHPNGQLIVDVVPAIELIIGAQPPVAALDPFESQNRFKLVFQNFVQVFCKKTHPLVLFLDDMQWADAASLNLVTLIATARATQSLLLVLTYRDNEVSATHPFMTTVTEQVKQGVQIHSIGLKALASSDVAQFISDALYQDGTAALALAEIIHQKTGGNPFFMRQFLQTLHAEKLIYLRDNAFHYDLAAIQSAAITENVAEFLASKIDRLPANTRAALRVAAAIGARFSLQTLASVNGSQAGALTEDLKPAIDDGLIVPTSGLETLDAHELDSPLVYKRFAFLHDRVQQAAYSKLAADERPALHLAIGRALRAESTGALLDGRVFDVVNHLNQGIAHIADPRERLQLAEFNIKAGTKARNSTAYHVAARCFRHAVELLDRRGWTEHHSLQVDAHVRLGETLCLTADYRAAFEVIDEALAQATSVIDRSNLYTIKTNIHLSMGDMPGAVECGRVGAGLFAIELPVEREKIEQMLSNETGAILARTDSEGIEWLLDLPAMRDPQKLALMPLLAHCLPAAYQTDQAMFALITCKMVTLSLEHGNCGLSARAYGSFAALLASAFGRYKDAYRFAKLGVDLSHRLNDLPTFSSTYFLSGMFGSHWNRPINESIELFRQATRYGIQSGDHQHAGYGAARCTHHLYFRGQALDEVQADAAAAQELLLRLGDKTNLEFLAPRLNFVGWLRGERDDSEAAAQREQALTEIIKASGNKTNEADWFMLRGIQRYYQGRFAAALELARTADELVPFFAGHITRAEHIFYYSLIVTSYYDEATPDERSALDAVLDRNRSQLGNWADHCPENFLAMHLLVGAEHARIRGARLEAMDLYERAINAAREQSFVNVEALAAELAARFWFATDKPDFGKLYLDKALHAYEIWGALGRAADLRAAHGLNAPRQAESAITAAALGTGSEHGDALDLATVLKASQVISGEIVLERLVGTLMDIVIENAGADLAVLVLETDGEYLVQGVKAAGTPARLLIAEPLSESVALSKGIANYVIRTSEHLVLSDPALRGKFRSDPYVVERQPKSVLCAPVSHKGKLTGVIYLENSQVADAFTPDRLEALNVLMAQIAVSIENATLYTKQEQQTRAIEAANGTLVKEIGERTRAETELGRYRDHLEELVKERTSELEKAQTRLVDMSRRAGMAEVASGVLHNVGNVMNSVNVGASVTREAVKALPVDGVARVCDLLEQNAERLPEYLHADPTGSKLPQYLRMLGAALAREQTAILAQIDQLSGHLEHMKTIIAAQQSYAKVNGMSEVCTLEEIAEGALQISEGVLRNSGIDVVRNYEKVPPVLVDRHQIMQILVNLISNAKHALEASRQAKREVVVGIASVDGGVRIEVRDNGVGISADNLPRIFNHGFTTKKDGHGFGLHNCANAAQQMDGSITVHSDGPGKGASFVLRFPVAYAERHGGQGNRAGALIR